ncbi:MAG: hypothetical protein JXA92_01410 [candidate division Zixibacteria bacterium]|nr:hypothetical protein [candidate division Zixibacteria bacterium]
MPIPETITRNRLYLFRIGLISWLLGLILLFITPVALTSVSIDLSFPAYALSLLSFLVTALCTSCLAEIEKRNESVWFFIGLISGVIGLFIIYKLVTNDNWFFFRLGLASWLVGVISLLSIFSWISLEYIYLIIFSYLLSMTAYITVAVCVSCIAENKNHNEGLWFIIGLFTTIIGLLIIQNLSICEKAVIKKRTEEQEKSFWTRVVGFYGLGLTVVVVVMILIYIL